ATSTKGRARPRCAAALAFSASSLGRRHNGRTPSLLRADEPAEDHAKAHAGDDVRDGVRFHGSAVCGLRSTVEPKNGDWRPETILFHRQDFQVVADAALEAQEPS